ncbi:MAG: peptidylprolyl isomerase [Verrucomicrobiota bacterium]
MKSLFAITAVVALTFAELAAGEQVLLKTSLGDITLELDAEKAPATVANFLAYVDSGHYNDTVFHRVIDGFMIQGGGFGRVVSEGAAADGGGDVEIVQKSTNPPVKNEAKNGLKNDRGTIAMARTGDPHSATSQFFINHGANNQLDYPSFDNWGYAVFGKVVSGMDVVDKIAAVETATRELTARDGERTMARPMDDVPVTDVIIESATRVTSGE